MSRHIQTANPEFRMWNHENSGNKLLFTNMKGKIFAFLLQGGQLTNVQVLPLKSSSKIGEIYIGKVKNIVKNMDACFVEIGDGQICYLPLKEFAEAEKPVQGFELPVQIVRDAIKTKTASVTTAIELSSEYFVFKKDMSGLAVSNKIDRQQSARIKKLLKDVTFQNEFIPAYGAIVRTKSQELDDTALVEKFIQQQNEFNEIFKKAKYRKCFSCIKSNHLPVISFLLENSAWNYDEIITDIPEIYQMLEDYRGKSALRLYADETISLTNLYSLQTKLAEACNAKVWLNSGANLIIEQTECLTAIDVNSSKNINNKVSEEANFHINMEAAKEAARQIRLRNLSGIIIIDFINMKNSDNNLALLHSLREWTADDPVTTKVIDMTPLGLVEITRKKIHMPLSEQLKE